MGKVVTLETLLREIPARWPQPRVAFTNGCFDVLHSGHVLCLETAARRGNCLVVGLNGDASVRALKGHGRPINPVEDRAAVLAALACVDYVVVFDDPTPVELVKALRPAVLVKGAEYRGQQIPGEEYAGRVHFVPMLAGRSTTATLRRLEDSACP